MNKLGQGGSFTYSDNGGYNNMTQQLNAEQMAAIKAGTPIEGVMDDTTGNYLGQTGFTGTEYVGPGLMDWGWDKGIGLAKLGLGAGQLYTGIENMNLQRDAFDFNKGLAGAKYAASATQLNNAIGRSNAVDNHYGIQSPSRQKVKATL